MGALVASRKVRIRKSCGVCCRMHTVQRWAHLAQCTRSATIWSSSRTRDPYFGILGATLVVKGTGLRSRWVPRAPNCPQAPEPIPSALELR